MEVVNSDLLKKAHGEDVITPAEKEELQGSIPEKTGRLDWFNTEKGCRLRRLVRGHIIRRMVMSDFCSLCVGSYQNTQRRKTNAYCIDCKTFRHPVPHPEDT